MTTTPVPAPTTAPLPADGPENAWDGNEETQNDPEEKRVLYQALDSY
jgi:hypothetical protein